MKRIVITGPTGAIGMALIQKCIEEEMEVLAICHRGSKRIPNIPRNDLVTVLEADLSEYESLRIEGDKKYDVFYHFAWNGTFGDSRNNMPLQVCNIHYTLDAVELARRLGCHTFIGAGSQAEYGRVEGVLKPDLKTNPENGYGMAKLCAGMMSRQMCDTMGIRHIWTRILSVYGPYDGADTMIMYSLNKMLRNEPTSFTKGEQLWDYLYSEDAADAMLCLGKKGVHGKIYCLGSGEAHPLFWYIKKMQEAVKSTADLGLGERPYAQKQVMHLEADISGLQKDTGFKVQNTFEEGIQKTIAYMILQKF